MSNQSIQKEINPEYSLEGLKLKLQYFGHLMQKADSLEKTLMLGKTEDSACSHEIKRHLLLGSKDMTNLDSILKSRDIITLLTKVCIVKSMVFPVVMYRCESLHKEG